MCLKCKFLDERLKEALEENRELLEDLSGDDSNEYLGFIVGKEPAKQKPQTATHLEWDTKEKEEFIALLGNPEAAWKEIMGQKGGAQ